MEVSSSVLTNPDTKSLGQHTGDKNERLKGQNFIQRFLSLQEFRNTHVHEISVTLFIMERLHNVMYTSGNLTSGYFIMAGTLSICPFVHSSVCHVFDVAPVSHFVIIYRWYLQ